MGNEQSCDAAVPDEMPPLKGKAPPSPALSLLEHAAGIMQSKVHEISLRETGDDGIPVVEPVLSQSSVLQPSDPPPLPDVSSSSPSNATGKAPTSPASVLSSPMPRNASFNDTAQLAAPKFVPRFVAHRRTRSEHNLSELVRSRLHGEHSPLHSLYAGSTARAQGLARAQTASALVPTARRSQSHDYTMHRVGGQMRQTPSRVSFSDDLSTTK